MEAENMWKVISRDGVFMQDGVTGHVMLLVGHKFFMDVDYEDAPRAICTLIGDEGECWIDYLQMHVLFEMGVSCPFRSVN